MLISHCLDTLVMFSGSCKSNIVFSNQRKLNETVILNKYYMKNPNILCCVLGKCRGTVALDLCINPCYRCHLLNKKEILPSDFLLE